MCANVAERNEGDCSRASVKEKDILMVNGENLFYIPKYFVLYDFLTLYDPHCFLPLAVSTERQLLHESG
jgi:hypothetical protein